MYSRLSVIFILQFLIPFSFFLVIAHPVYAERSLEWRDDGLWVISDGDESLFAPLDSLTVNGWTPRVASLSPDGEWVAFVKHTGGGFENEGQSCFIARWNGDDERLLHRTDWLVPALYWLEGSDGYYVAVQRMSGGTMYGCNVAVVDFQTGDTLLLVEGLIYDGSTYGARTDGEFWDTFVGFHYEVLGENEEPVGWGTFYVDEIIEYPVQSEILQVDGMSPDDHPLTDGKTSSAWIVPTQGHPSVNFIFNGEAGMRGIRIQSGWLWHDSPSPDERPWQSVDVWPMYDRPREILFGFSDGSGMEVELDDARSTQWIFFDEGVPLDMVTITVLSVYRGTHFDSVAISEIFAF